MQRVGERGGEIMFVGIKEGSKLIGITPSELRAGLKEGRYPFIMRGKAYLINPDTILKELEQEAQQNRRQTLDAKEKEEAYVTSECDGI